MVQPYKECEDKEEGSVESRKRMMAGEKMVESGSVVCEGAGIEEDGGGGW